MPPEPHSTHSNRRVSRKATNDDDVDLRRARGEISCAECRRLKLKCDKKLPCGSCTRRGCPSICPNGTLSTGQGTRFVLADTNQLHSKIGEMGQRIRELEDALAIFQAGVSTETHALLRDDLLQIKFGPDKGTPAHDRRESARDDSMDSIDALGTLTVGESGQAKYFGRSAGSEALLLAGADLETVGESDILENGSKTLNEVIRLAQNFPFGAEIGDPEAAMDILLDHLPSRPRAWTLLETYMEHAAWAFRPLKRDEIVDDFLSPVYKMLKENQSGTPRSTTVSFHKLAVLFTVFAIGTFVDLTLENYQAESTVFYYLAKAALSMRSVFDSPEIATVQAIVLMASFHSVGGKGYTMDSAWSLMSLGFKLAQSNGLHRESSRFDMDSKTVERRRALFWEIFSNDVFYSLATGRPPSIRISYVDCEFPQDDEATLDSEGNVQKGYYRWKYEFTKEIAQQVIELTLTAEPPTYQTVLDLDRKVREKVLPPHLNVFITPDNNDFTLSTYMRGCLLGQYRTITLIYIHRSFFAQAMLDHPANPLRSHFAPSFLAAYRCASGVIKSNLNHFDKFPELCCRWWTIWTHLFSAAIIVGSIVTRSPASSMASSAFIELGLACDIFQKGAFRSNRARSGLAILQKLRDKAFHVYSSFRSGNSTPTPILSVGRPDYGDDELALFGGQTRVLVSKLLSRKPTRHRTLSPANSSTNLRESGEGKSPAEATPDVHPSLVEYLSSFPIESGNGQINGNTHITHNSAFASQAPSPSSIAAPEAQHAPWAPPAVNFTAIPNQSEWTGYNYNMEVSSPTSYVPREYQASSYPASVDSPENMMDLGLMMTGDSGVDEQWVSFMRQSGLLGVSSNNMGNATLMQQ